MAEPVPPLPRHQLAWIAPAAWPEMIVGQPAWHAILEEWAGRDWPLIARRPACDDPHTLVPLGLPLPPSLGKARLSFCLPAALITRAEPPPTLTDTVTSAPDPWRRTIDALIALNVRVRCFGGLAWQHLTRLPYLSPSSDLDLLWPVVSQSQADRLGFEIAAIESDAPVRIDGEFVTDAGNAVQWREWLSDASELLVRSTRGAQILTRKELFA